MKIETQLISNAQINLSYNEFLVIFSQIKSFCNYSTQDLIRINSELEFISFFPDFNDNPLLLKLKKWLNFGASFYLQNLYQAENKETIRFYKNSSITSGAWVREKTYSYSLANEKDLSVIVDLTGLSKGSYFLIENIRFSTLVWVGEAGDLPPIPTENYFKGIRIEPDTFPNMIDDILQNLSINSSYICEKLNDFQIRIGQTLSYSSINHFDGINGIYLDPIGTNSLIQHNFFDEKTLDLESKFFSDVTNLKIEIARDIFEYQITIFRESQNVRNIAEIHSGTLQEVLESLAGSGIVTLTIYKFPENLPTGIFSFSLPIKKSSQDYEIKTNEAIESLESLSTDYLPDYCYDAGIQNINYYEYLSKKFNKSIKICHPLIQNDPYSFYYINQTATLDGLVVDSLDIILNAVFKNSFGQLTGVTSINPDSYVPPIGFRNTINYIQKSSTIFILEDPYFVYNKNTKIKALDYNFITYITRQIVSSDLRSSTELTLVLDSATSYFNGFSNSEYSATLDSVEQFEDGTLTIHLVYSLTNLKIPDVITLTTIGD